MEGLDDLLIRGRIVFDKLVKGFVGVDENQKRVVEQEVVESGLESFLILKLKFIRFWYILKLLVPYFFIFFFRDEFVADDACLAIEGGGIPAHPNSLVDFAHLPPEVSFVETCDVGRDERHEYLAELCQLFLELGTVELKGVVHDVTVVEGRHY